MADTYHDGTYRYDGSITYGGADTKKLQREYQHEFETEAHYKLGTSTSRRPDAVSLDYLTCFTIGPIREGDVSQGMLHSVWRVRAVDNSVLVSRENDDKTAWEDEVELFSYEGAPILEIDAAFEQNGRLVVCAERATFIDDSSEIWLYWYDPTVPGFVFSNLGSGRTPRALLDDPFNVQDSDVLLLYVSDLDDSVVLRQQRDRYEDEILVPIGSVGGKYLEEVAKARDGRLHVIYSSRDIPTGKYFLATLESTLYGFYLEANSMTASADAVSGELVVVVIVQDFEDNFTAGVDILPSTLVSPIIDVNVDVTDPNATHSIDVENIQAVMDILSGILALPIIEHVEDIENFRPTVDINSGTLVDIVISSTLDIENFRPTVDINSGTLVVP